MNALATMAESWRERGADFFARSLLRELREELDWRVEDLPKPQLVGLINDDSTEVGSTQHCTPSWEMTGSCTATEHRPKPVKSLMSAIFFWLLWLGRAVSAGSMVLTGRLS